MSSPSSRRVFASKIIAIIADANALIFAVPLHLGLAFWRDFLADARSHCVLLNPRGEISLHTEIFCAGELLDDLLTRFFAVWRSLRVRFDIVMVGRFHQSQATALRTLSISVSRHRLVATVGHGELRCQRKRLFPFCS